MIGIEHYLLAGSLVLFGQSALACSGSIQLPDWNKPIKVATQCRFENAGKITKAEFSGLYGVKHMRNDNTSGQQAIDRGEGIVSQVIATSRVCGREEYMLISDCSAGKSIALHGTSPPVGSVQIAGFALSAVKYAIGKEGRVNLHRGETLEAFSAKARQQSLRVTEVVSTLQNGWKRKDRYDPACGCKLFYPDSAGATQ